jgi:ComF family protein
VGAAYYQDAIAEAIKLFKFKGRLRLAEPLAELMIERAEEELADERYDYVMPVPLYKVRERARGYNQALLLAEAILPTFAGSAIDQSLMRIRPTRTQSKLKSEGERRENVRGAFTLEEGAHLKGKTILLVDDVVTSGGTANECAAVLRRAGVAHVDVLAVALAVTTLPLTGHNEGSTEKGADHG